MKDAQDAELVQDEAAGSVEADGEGPSVEARRSMPGVDPSATSEEPLDGAQASDEVTVLRTQVADLQNKLLRVYADLENLRRRSRIEKDELATYANGKLITDLLPVLDHLGMALQAAEQAEGHSNDLAKGVDMVFKQFVGVLQNAGVETLDPAGETFDPNRHEAVMSEPVDGMEAGIVVQVLRTGYALGERVLRPAMVKVSG